VTSAVIDRTKVGFQYASGFIMEAGVFAMALWTLDGIERDKCGPSATTWKRCLLVLHEFDEGFCALERFEGVQDVQEHTNADGRKKKGKPQNFRQGDVVFTPLDVRSHGIDIERDTTALASPVEVLFVGHTIMLSS
ncbi:3239_t:CDS:2, partial [Acaulospora colombiana]